MTGKARAISSWLSGPEPAGAGDHPGRRLGFPRSGPGSPAGFGRRLFALTLDYFIAVGLTALAVPLGWLTQEAFQYSTAARFLIIAVWLVLGMVAVRLFGFTPGQFAGGLRVATVATVDAVYALDTVDTVNRRGHIGSIGLGRAFVRGLLVALVIPALFIDADGRGLQDRATRTAVVRR